jgi:hypothetical protein
MIHHSSLFQFKHGDHACIFYRDEEHLREVLVPYIAEGLRKGERCFCAQKAHFGRQLIYDLNFLGIDTEAEMKRGALEIHTEDEVYFPNKRFEPLAMMDMLLTSLDDTIARGFSGFRTAGELSWATQGETDCDQLLTYEKIVDKAFPGRAVTGICQYDVNLLAPEILKAVTEAHRLNLSAAKASSFYTGLSVRNGNYNIEIVADKLVIDPKYYYVVQQNRPREIIAWGTAGNFEAASQQAEAMLAHVGSNGRA